MNPYLGIQSGGCKSKKTNIFLFIKRSRPGLPDGIFSNQKSQFGEFLEGLIYLIDIKNSAYILRPCNTYIGWTFGAFCCNLVHFPVCFGMYHEKSGNPGY
jgi:hypothetical protein